MLSYLHGFHAGNHADVLKHVTLVALLDALAAKRKPLRYVDTHAGAGSYDLRSPAAQRNREHQLGVGKLWAARRLPAAVERWRELVRECNAEAARSASGPAGSEPKAGADRVRLEPKAGSDPKRVRALVRYPGSPWLARRCLGPADSLYFYELHPAEHRRLARECANDRRVRVLREDGLRGCIGLVPPPERRAVVFVDPSYETEDEHRLVADALGKAQRRFATGVYVVWYPVIDRRWVERYVRAVRGAGRAPLHRYELCVARDGAGRGLTGSGMLIANPPWKLDETLGAALPWLAERLAIEHGAGYRIEDA